MCHASALAIAIIYVTACNQPVPALPLHPDEQKAHAELIRRGCRLETREVGKFIRVTKADLTDYAGNLERQTADEELELARSFTDLKALTLNHVTLSERSFRALGGLRELEELDLTSSKGNSDWLVHLRGCSNLKVLRLIGQPLRKPAVSVIAGFGRLKILEIGSGESDPSAFQELGKLCELQVLFLSVSDKIRELPFIRSHSQLQELSLATPGLDDDAVTVLAGCPELRILRLTNSPRLTEKALEQIGRLTHLRQLWLAKTAVSDRGLAHLADLKDMRYLNLGATAVTASGMAHLKGMKELKTLSLEGTVITNAGMDCLGSLSSLEILHLQGTQVTDEHLPALYGLKNLRSFTFGRNVTSEAEAKLKDEVKKAREKP